jgi:flagellar protein FliS
MMNQTSQPIDKYLVQRVMGASPEQQIALLMEGGQRFLGKAIKAMEQKEYSEMGRCLARVTEIINEATLRLNHEDGGELVENLVKVYDWWTWEVFEASATKDPVRLTAVSHHMGEIRQAWEQLHEKQARAAHGAAFQVGDRVV